MNHAHMAAFVYMKISDPLRGAATCSGSFIGSHVPLRI
jgi:hypothetical protein